MRKKGIALLAALLLALLAGWLRRERRSAAGTDR